MNKRQETIEQTVKSDGEGNSDRELNSKGVDAAGTLHKRSIETETEVKSNGNMVITQEDKKVTDPKGLANKTVVKTEIEKVKAPDGSTVSAKVKRKVNGEVVQDQVQ